MVTFRRCLINNLRDTWEHISDKLLNFKLQEGSNLVSWKLEKNSRFSVESVQCMTSSDVSPNHKKIWRGKVPAKIKILCG